MYYFANFCIVCFSCDKKLKRLTDTDADNIRLLEKLKYCSGEKVYENVSQFICNDCCTDLSRAYNFKKKVLASRNYLKSYLLKFLKHSDNNKCCCNVYVSLVDIRRARNLSNYVKQHVTNDPIVCDEESKNCPSETSTTPKDFFLLRRSCVENKETESYTQRKFNNEIRETITEMIHTNVEYKKEKNEEEIEKLIKQENIEIEEHNIDTYKNILNKVNKQIKLEEEVEKSIEVQPTWILKPVGSVDENKQEKNDTETEVHMPVNRYQREKDISDNEDSVFEESKIDIDEDFDDKALAKEQMIDIPQISVNEKTSDENINNYDMRTEGRMHKKVFSCLVCQKDFSQKGSLQRHMLTHTGEKPFECTICSQRFRTKCSVNEHMLIHSNEKPHCCDICNKRYRHRCSLRLHMRWHENPEYRRIKHEKVYTCTLCQRDFNYQPNLQRHMLVHTGEKPFKCNICLQRFTAKHSLKQHNMAKHNNEKPFSCHICNKQFKYGSYLRKHVRQHEDAKSCTDSTPVTEDTSENSNLDVMETQDGNKDRTQTVSTNMQKRRKVYLRQNMNAEELIVGLSLNETDEEVEDETVVKTVKKIKEETVQDVDEFNKPLKMQEDKDETEQSEFETVFICC